MGLSISQAGLASAAQDSSASVAKANAQTEARAEALEAEEAKMEAEYKKAMAPLGASLSVAATNRYWVLFWVKAVIPASRCWVYRPMGQLKNRTGCR